MEPRLPGEREQPQGKALTLDQRRACLALAKLYAIVDTSYVAADRVLTVAGELVRSGVDVLQFRAKNWPLSEIVNFGRELRSLIPPLDAPQPGPLFILNDHPGLVEEMDADGVHVGQDDLGVATAREQAGADVLVGKSTHSLEQAIAGEREGADYIGVGPLFATPTKPDYVPVGLELIGQVAGKVRVPQFCIGGVNENTLPAVLAAGARRIVIVSDLLRSGDIPAYCRRVRELLEAGAP
jgi:thiamine-phosphate pyrophosphorylase